MDQFTERRRHSAAHVLAMAAQRLFPNVKLGIGPVTSAGFYHDFEFPRHLEWEDVKNLEAEMNLIIQENLPFNHVLVPRDQAFGILMTRGQVYKSELLQDIPDEELSFYQTGEEFIDLCRGPHVDSTNKIGVVKLLEITDVQWRNDPERPTLQRIHGVAFPTPAELVQHLERLDAIKTRDFRKYAYDLELIAGENEQLLYTDRGAITLSLLRNTIASHLLNNGFKPIIPGHTATVNGLIYYLNDFFSHKNRSYRTMPVKAMAETRALLDTPIKISGKAFNYIYEINAAQFCTEGQVFNETKNMLNLCLDILNDVQIRADAQLYASDQELPVFKQLAEMLAQKGISQTQIINAQIPPQSATLKFIVQDSLKREWPIMELNYVVAKTEYVQPDGEFAATHNFYIHLTLEQLLAFYLEELEGSLPFWLSPMQCVVVPIGDEQANYANGIVEMLNRAGIRAETDIRAETMQARIREAELAKIPVILVVGEKEQNAKAVSVRLRNKQELGLIGEDILVETLQKYVEQSDRV